MNQIYDVTIIGSGIGGSSLALTLARQGLSVLLLEKARHPRFALGEAGIKETSLTFSLLAETFDLPELRALGSAGQVRRHIGKASGQKQSFTFFGHKPGAEWCESDVCQVGSPSFPFGVDSHYNRAEVDHYLVQKAKARGVEIREGIAISAIEVTKNGVDVYYSGEKSQCRLLVDGPGLFPDPPKPHQTLPSLQTQSYCIFSHMKGVGKMPREQAKNSLPQDPFHGTTHHLFPGGWLWVIPFHNYKGGEPITSVGLVLDPRIHPPTDENPHTQFQSIVGHFSTLKSLLRDATPLFPLIKTQALQYIRDPWPTERIIRPAHGVGFVDPLFSRGLYLTARSVFTLAHAIPQAIQGDTAGLKAHRDWSLNALVVTDKLIHAAYLSFDDFQVFNAWHRIWALGVFLESLRMTKVYFQCLNGQLNRPDGPSFPVDLPDYKALTQQGEATLRAMKAGEYTPSEATERLMNALNNCPVLPPSLDYGNPNTRHLGTHSIHERLPMRLWALHDSRPSGLRDFFNFPRSALPKALARRWF